MGFRQKIKQFFLTWNNQNVFDFRMGDSIAYFFLYIVIPVSVTTLSLIEFPDDISAAAYFYLTIAISVANSIYDNALRWTPKTAPSFKNLKLLCALIPNVLVGIYCLFEILAILSVNLLSLRCDYFLFFYLIPTLIATKDICECIKRKVITFVCVS